MVDHKEHHAVLSPCHTLGGEGFDVTYLPVNKDGFVNPKDVKRVLRSDTFLISIIYANNEIGTVEPIAEIAKVVRHHCKDGNKTYLHTDACQAPGALSLNVAKLGVDLMTISGSKIYGPKGIGALYIKDGINIESLFYGGGQEGGIRSGTENVAGIVGFGESLVISQGMREKESKRLTDLRNYFADALIKQIPYVEINGSMRERLPNNLNVYIPNIESEQLVIELDAIGVAVSAGSACHSNSAGGSHVIWAISHDSKRINGSVRFTIGRSTTKKDVDFVLKSLPEIFSRIKIKQ
ncbi:MAG: cysteine desulfurase [Candidatus Vogelbacteria bacterium]|nr:cysteine desulfurase [Candidatus Vogelbacteria bacterium]